jgi:hypothetical protein
MSDIVGQCPHDITERDVAVSADGYCPLCMADEIERLRAELKASESLKRGYFDEIERLRAEVALWKDLYEAESAWSRN